MAIEFNFKDGDTPWLLLPSERKIVRVKIVTSFKDNGANRYLIERNDIKENIHTGEEFLFKTEDEAIIKLSRIEEVKKCLRKN